MKDDRIIIRFKKEKKLLDLILKSAKKTKSTLSEWMRDAAREKLGLAVILALCLMGCDSVTGPTSQTYTRAMILTLETPLAVGFPEVVTGSEGYQSLTVQEFAPDSQGIFAGTMKIHNVEKVNYSALLTFYPSVPQNSPFPDTLTCNIFAVWDVETGITNIPTIAAACNGILPAQAFTTVPNSVFLRRLK